MSKLFHLVDVGHESTDKRTLDRKWKMQESWDSPFESGEMIPCHFHDYPRNAKTKIGDARPLPYFKDALQFAMNQCRSDDIIFWQNDDNACHRELPELLKFWNSVYGPCSIFRTELRGALPSSVLSPEQVARYSNERHVGRDGFSFKKSWLEENWEMIPNAILGASMWDCHLACVIRLFAYGIKTTNKNIWDEIKPAEIPKGYSTHIAHTSAWSTNQNFSAANRWNGALFKEFAAEYLPDLKVTAEGNLA